MFDAPMELAKEELPDHDRLEVIPEADAAPELYELSELPSGQAQATLGHRRANTLGPRRA